MSRYSTVVSNVIFMGEVYPVNSGNGGKRKTDPVILKRILAQVEAMLSYHSKIVVVRFDLHQPEYTPDNQHLNRFFDKARRFAQREHGIKRMGYGWVREQERAKNQHYHCFVVLNGDAVRNPKKLIAYMQNRWHFTQDGSFHIPENHLYRVNRNNDAKRTGNMVYRLSYLAKARGKGYAGKMARDFSTSKIKPKPATQGKA